MKILIAEDHPVMRQMLERMLNKWGYDVIVTCDGDEAWQVLRNDNSPPLAILDRMMPGVDGASLCRRLRENSPTSRHYVLLLTSKNQNEDIVSGLSAGADDYVTKPFEPEVLRARVQVGERVLKLQSSLAERVRELEDALGHVKTLQGILPICVRCHNIRNDRNAWERLEKYISEHTDARFSHGLCPSCLHKHYGDILGESRIEERH